MKHFPLTQNWQFCLDAVDFEFYDNTAKTVDLPHDFIMEKPRHPKGISSNHGGYYDGAHGTYRMEFEHPGTAVCQIFVDGVQGITDVQFNGHRVDSQVNGYMPFVTDVTKYLKSKNELMFFCNHWACPSDRWYAGGGLYRTVELLTAPKVHIPKDGIYTKTLSLEGEKALQRFEVTVAGGVGDVVLRIYDAEGALYAEKRAADAKGTVIFDADMPADKLWSAEMPYLWRAEATVQSSYGEDSETLRFGVRTVQCDGAKGLLINGWQVKLRGGCVHHDNGPVGACGYKDSEYRRITYLKEAGFNAIRCAHNPPSTALLEVCDELGMYVIDEAFDVWRNGKVIFDYHLFFNEWWERNLTAMILRDRSHPSIILWSTGNEISERTGITNGYETANAICKKIRELDDRPLTHALCQVIEEEIWNLDGEKLGDETMDVFAKSTAPCAACHDVVGYNYLHGRVEADKALFPNRLIAFTETVPGEVGEAWKKVMAHDYCIGDFVWTCWDYLGEAGIGHIKYEALQTWGVIGTPYYTANCGDFDLCGTRRPQSYFHEVVWGKRTAPYMAVMEPWNACRKQAISYWGFTDLLECWNFEGWENALTQVYVYASGDECELILNGEVIKRQPIKDWACIFKDVPYRPGELKAVVYRNGEKVGETALTTTGKAEKLCIEHIWEGEELVYADVVIRDAHGRQVMDDRLIRVCAENARVLAMGNGDAQSTEQYPVTEHRSWRGRVTVVMKKQGNVILHATADGFPEVMWAQGK